MLASLGGGLLSAAGGLHAAAPEADPALQRLRQLSLEELLNLEVVTVSKKEQRLADTAAAVSVLTGDDIRRSGVTHVAEALRFVPGVQVARLNAHQWAISVRGFNGIFANKLLVLVDGRSVYTPLSSGILWEYQDLSLESVERIEVVRGPGASVWGANAVNGVINIITQSAKETQGGHVAVGGGDLDQFITTASYGAALSDAADLEGWSPKHQLFVQSQFQLTKDVELDANVRYVDELSGPGIPAYVTADVRVGWKPRADLELSIVGQNLFDSPHQEFEPTLINYTPSMIARSFFGKITWSF